MPASDPANVPGPPSAWIARFLPDCDDADAPNSGRLLDLAAGRGRHAVLAHQRGWRVIAADRDTTGLAELGLSGIKALTIDLEARPPEEVAAQLSAKGPFGAIIVANYLHRPLLPLLPGLLAPGGLLLYETFMAGNEAYGRPRNPDFLLQPDELFHTFAGSLSVAAFEQGYDADPTPRMIQRIFCVNGSPRLSV